MKCTNLIGEGKGGGVQKSITIDGIQEFKYFSKLSTFKMSTLKPSPPASPTTMAFYAWLERPPSPLPIPVPLTPRQFFPLPISPNFFNYTILAPNSTPSSPAKKNRPELKNASRLFHRV